MDNSLFDNALAFVRRGDPDFKPGIIQPQKRPTSVDFDGPGATFMEAKPVRLLLDELPAPPNYRKDGELAKRQPAPYKKGDQLWVKLGGDGLLDLVPFSMAGSGYELVKDAIEGVHFEFVDSEPGSPRIYATRGAHKSGGTMRPKSWLINWPFMRLSNGIELELRERIKVRSRATFIAQGQAKKRVEAGDEIYAVHDHPGQFLLVVQDEDTERYGLAFRDHDYGDDFRPYHGFGQWDAVENAKEGIHFDVIPGEKVVYPDIALRKEMNRHMKPSEALTRAKRELSADDLRKMMR